MKSLKIITQSGFKAYRPNSEYKLDGDLIILSGINGSGKSQLLKLIANKKESFNVDGSMQSESFSRDIFQCDGVNELKLETIKLFSFKDNINIYENFGVNDVNAYSNNKNIAWNYYKNNIRGKQDIDINNLIYDYNRSKNPNWESIIELYNILNEKFDAQKVLNLTKEEFFDALPISFVFINEDAIVNQVTDLFFSYACQVNSETIKCYKENKKINAELLNQNAPWTRLNKLFEKLGFKYRFLDNYEYKYTSLDNTPCLLENNEIRQLRDLSDGERTILKIALYSLENEIHGNAKLILFDEYDATLNPSLIEAFFEVLDEFYIKKGIQVIIATHSSVTISLAPDYTNYYEVFNYDRNKSPQLIPVNRFEYSEIREINKTYYKRLIDQPSRFLKLSQQKEIVKNTLFVEDRYLNIYKIAYLKLREIQNITAENIDSLFKSNANYEILSGNGAGNLKNILLGSGSWKTKFNLICLFDFDQEGKRNFDTFLYDSNYEIKNSDYSTGLYVKNKYKNRYALMLPIPERLSKYISNESSKKCLIAVESLLSSNYLENSQKATLYAPYVDFYEVKDNNKASFWVDLLNADSSVFTDFRPLFEQIDSIFNNN